MHAMTDPTDHPPDDLAPDLTPDLESDLAPDLEADRESDQAIEIDVQRRELRDALASAHSEIADATAALTKLIHYDIEYAESSTADDLAPLLDQARLALRCADALNATVVADPS